MFCEKCGKPTEGDQTLCNECLAKQSVVPPESAPTEQAADTFELRDTNTAPAKKTPKKKTGLIAGIAALAIVVAAVLGVVFNLDSINGFIGRTFQSPEEYLANVESAYIAEYSAALTQSYGTLLKNSNADQTAAEAEIRLTLDEEVLSLLETLLQQQGVSMDLGWLQEIKMSTSANIQESAMQMGLGIGLGKTDLLSADVIFDLENGTGYVAIPEINKDYLYADLSYDISIDELKALMAQSTELNSKLLKALPSEEDLNQLINTYAEIVLSGIDNVEKQDDSITINGISQKVVVLTAKITQEDLLDIAEDLIKEAEKDKTLKKVLTAFGDYVNEMGALNDEYYYPVDLYQEFQASIPGLLDSLQEARENAEKDNYIKLKAYVDMKNNIRGHELAVYIDGKKDGDTISWLTVVDGNTTYTEANLAEAQITGELTEERGVAEGFYALRVDGMKVGTLEFENMTETGGTLRLIPGEDLLSEILSDSNIPTFLLSDNLALELSYDVQDKQVSYGINILVGGKEMISLDMSSAVSKGGKITIPANALNASREADVMKWLQDADFNQLLSAMEECNIPQELIDTVSVYASMLQGQLG